MGCENLATKSDIRRLEGKIQALNQKLQTIINLINRLSSKIDSIKQLIKSLENIIKTQINAAKEIILAAIGAVKSILQSIFAFLQRVFAPKPPEIDYNRISKIANKAADRGASKAIKAINNAKTQITQKIDNLEQRITDRLSKIAQRTLKILNTVNKILQAIKNLKPEIDYNRISRIANKAANDARIRIAQKIDNLENRLIDRLSKIAQRTLKILNAVNKLLKRNFDTSQLEQKIDNLENRLIDRLSKIAQRTLTIQNDVKKLLSRGFDTSQLEQKIDNLENRLIDRLSKIAQRTLKILNAVNKLLNRGFDTSQLEQKIENLQQRVIDRLSKNAQRTLQIKNTTDKLLDLLKAIKKKIDKIFQWSQELYPFFKTLADGAWDALVANVQRILNILGGFRWFNNNNDLSPNLTLDNLEGKVRISGETQGLEDGEGGTAVNRDLIDLITNEIAIPYYRLGGQEYPAEVPESLTAENDQQVQPKKISNYASLFEWYIGEFDGLVGQFPIKIKIEDNDLIATGDQPIEIDLPNIAETLAELTGKAITNEARVNALQTTALKDIAEVGSTRTLALKNNAILLAIMEYLGFQTDQELEKVPFQFNPIDTVTTDNQEGDESLTTALQSKEIEIELIRNNDDDTLESQLGLLVEMARMYKGKNFQPIDLNRDPKGQILSLLKNGLEILRENNQEGDESFEQWLDRVEREFSNAPGKTDPDTPYGRSYNRRPRARDIGINDRNE